MGITRQHLINIPPTSKHRSASERAAAHVAAPTGREQGEYVSHRCWGRYPGMHAWEVQIVIMCFRTPPSSMHAIYVQHSIGWRSTRQPRFRIDSSVWREIASRYLMR
jgi:hypothetical protein